MGILSKIFGVGEAAVAPITAIGNVLDGLFTSKDEVLTHEAILTRLAQQPNLAQVELNKVEGAHRSVFVAGWRPFIGWVCGVGLINVFLINPWIQWITGSPGPSLPKDIILELVLALLGLGALRTVEKLKGKAK
jgi:hypothetical protein